jgi:general secretion pathway protein L
MLNFDSEIDVSLFFKWWWQQLSFLVPQKFLDALARDKNLLVVEINPASARISFVNQRQETVLGEFEFNELAKEELQSLIASNKEYSDAKVVLRVPEALSVAQDVFLPAAAESNLRQVMTYELDRYTPFGIGEKRQPGEHVSTLS